MLPMHAAALERRGAACAMKQPVWRDAPHVLFQVNETSLWRATRILGDEFSAMGLAVALGMPRPMVAQGLASMAEANWIALIPSGVGREEKHGPWYQPRSSWKRLRAAKRALALSRP